MFSILRDKAIKPDERSKRRLQEFNRLQSEKDDAFMLVARERENNARLAIEKWVPTMLANLKVSMWGFLNGGHW